MDQAVAGSLAAMPGQPTGSPPLPQQPRQQEQQRASPPAPGDELFSSDEFRMYAFKILPCSRRTAHEWASCVYAHPGEKARRRDPRTYSYLAVPCPDVKQNQPCPRGDQCQYCHSVFEYWLHPSRYRTQLCQNGANCRRTVCFFAHSVADLRTDPSHLNLKAGGGGGAGSGGDGGGERLTGAPPPPPPPPRSPAAARAAARGAAGALAQMQAAAAAPGGGYEPYLAGAASPLGPLPSGGGSYGGGLARPTHGPYGLRPTHLPLPARAPFARPARSQSLPVPGALERSRSLGGGGLGRGAPSAGGRTYGTPATPHRLLAHGGGSFGDGGAAGAAHWPGAASDCGTALAPPDLWPPTGGPGGALGAGASVHGDAGGAAGWPSTEWYGQAASPPYGAAYGGPGLSVHSTPGAPPPPGLPPAHLWHSGLPAGPDAIAALAAALELPHVRGPAGGGGGGGGRVAPADDSELQGLMAQLAAADAAAAAAWSQLERLAPPAGGTHDGAGAHHLPPLRGGGGGSGSSRHPLAREASGASDAASIAAAAAASLGLLATSSFGSGFSYTGGPAPSAPSGSAGPCSPAAAYAAAAAAAHAAAGLPPLHGSGGSGGGFLGSPGVSADPALTQYHQQLIIAAFQHQQAAAAATSAPPPPAAPRDRGSAACAAPAGAARGSAGSPPARCAPPSLPPPPPQPHAGLGMLAPMAAAGHEAATSPRSQQGTPTAAPLERRRSLQQQLADAGVAAPGACGDNDPAAAGGAASCRAPAAPDAAWGVGAAAPGAGPWEAGGGGGGCGGAPPLEEAGVEYPQPGQPAAEPLADDDALRGLVDALMQRLRQC